MWLFIVAILVVFVVVDDLIGPVGRFSDEFCRRGFKIMLFLRITNTFLIQCYYYCITKSVLADSCSLLVPSLKCLKLGLRVPPSQ